VLSVALANTVAVTGKPPAVVDVTESDAWPMLFVVVTGLVAGATGAGIGVRAAAGVQVTSKFGTGLQYLSTT